MIQLSCKPRISINLLWLLAGTWPLPTAFPPFSSLHPFSFSTYSSLALFGIRPPFIKIYLHFSRSVGQSRVVCIYHRYPPGGVLILLLLLMCRTTVKSANCAMNWNETTIAGGRHSNHLHVYQKINPQTGTCTCVRCEEKWRRDAGDSWHA